MMEQLPTTVGIELEFTSADHVSAPRPASDIRDEVFEAAESSSLSDAARLVESARAASAEAALLEPVTAPEPRRNDEEPVESPMASSQDEISRLRRRHRTLDEVARLMEAEGYEVQNFSSYRQSPVSMRYWDLKTDSSCGYEAASPVIANYSGLVRHTKVGDIIQRAGCHVTDSCGLHGHVRGQDFTVAQIESLIKLCLRYEAAFYMLMPAHRRRGTYCRGISSELSDAAKWCFRQTTDREVLFRKLSSVWGSKHSWLNCKPLSRQKTLEFRLMCGSLDPTFIVGYVMFLLHIVDTGVHARPGRWGKADAQSAATLFRSFLGAAGFYKPLSPHHDPDRAVLGRKWASKWAQVQHPDPVVPTVVATVGIEPSVRRIRQLDVHQINQAIESLTESDIALPAVEPGPSEDENVIHETEHQPAVYAPGDLIQVRDTDGTLQTFRFVRDAHTGRVTSSNAISLQAVPRPSATESTAVPVASNATSTSSYRITWSTTSSINNEWIHLDESSTNSVLSSDTATELGVS